MTCIDEGQYFDRKTEKCVNFTDLSDLKQDFEFKRIDVSYSHSYGMAFWIFFEEHRNVEQSVDFIWQYHMQMSLQYVGTTFKAYCFPQNYEPYSKILQNNGANVS